MAIRGTLNRGGYVCEDTHNLILRYLLRAAFVVAIQFMACPLI